MCVSLASGAAAPVQACALRGHAISVGAWTCCVASGPAAAVQACTLRGQSKISGAWTCRVASGLAAAGVCIEHGKRLRTRTCCAVRRVHADSSSILSTMIQRLQAGVGSACFKPLSRGNRSIPSHKQKQDRQISDSGRSALFSNVPKIVG
eukprot:1156876-Pelagomonas_calceolata.AAC.15